MTIHDQSKSDLYKSLVLNSGDAMFLFDHKGKILEVNKIACNELGYERDELLAMSVPDINPEFSSQKKIERHLIDLEKEKNLKLYTNHRSKDGRAFPVEVSLSIIVEDDKKMVLGIARDISDHVNDKENLHQYIQTLEKLHVILQDNKNIEDMVFEVLHLVQKVFKSDRVFLIASQDVNELYQIRPYEVIQENVERIFSNNQNSKASEYSSRIYQEIKRNGLDVYLSAKSKLFTPQNDFHTKSEMVIPMIHIGSDPLLFGIHQCFKSREWTDLEQKLLIDISHRLSDAMVRLFDRHFLEQSERKYRILYDNVPIAYQSLDEEGNFIDVNSTWLKMLNYTREEVIGKNFIDVMHADWHSCFYENFPKFKEKGYIHDAYFRLEDKNGVYKDISLEGCIGYHPDGSFRQSYCVLLDITDKKNAEEAISRVNEVFRVFVEQVPIPLCHVDNISGDILYTNKRFTEVFGYIQSDIPNLETWWRVAYPDDKYRDWVLDNWNKAVEYGKENKSDIIPDVYDVTCRNGDVKQILISGIVLGDDFLATFVDLTQQKKAEDELRTAKERAEESEKLKSAFLANMSHEIRTPMNGILGFADLLKSPKLSGEKQQKYIDIILQSGDRMLTTINDIIEVSKIETEQIEPIYEQIDINELIDHYFNFFLPEVKEKNLSFKQSKVFEKEHYLIVTDRSMFDSIFSNLIKNAIKYTKTGSIEFGYRERETQIEFYVKDTGIGIPEGMQKIIFDRFRQIDIESEETIEGSGLGLAITKAYIEMLGGEICLESEVGEGSEFIFTIPINRVVDDNKLDAVDSVVNTNSFNNLKILLAEDEENAREYMSLILEDIAEEILYAEDGEKALELARNHSDIDLILMDMKMPKMSGYEATSKIREFNKKIPIIAQTAFALSGDREKTLQAGCDDFITKPIKAKLLIEMINNVIQNKQ